MFDIAYASTTGTTGAGTGMGSTIMMIVLMIRPENKRKKQAEEMRNSLKKGDWLTTIGGVYGRVVSITDRTVVIETSEELRADASAVITHGNGNAVAVVGALHLDDFFHFIVKFHRIHQELLHRQAQHFLIGKNA